MSETAGGVDDVERVDAAGGLGRLAPLVAEYYRLEEAREAHEAAGKELDAKWKRLTEQELPDMMLEAGMEELKLVGGRRLSLHAETYARARSGLAAELARWLIESGNPQLVTSEFKLVFKRDEADAADAARDLLRQANAPYQEKQFVHPSTLSAFVREELAQGRSVPEDLVEVTPVRRAKIE